MILRNLSCWFFVVFLTVSCGGGKPDHPDESQIKAQGNSVVIELKTKLKGQLQEAMEKGGPVAAISHCQNTAPALTAATAKNQAGIVVGRTSSRIRNPDNAPDATDRKVLEFFQSAKDGGSEIPTELVQWPAKSGGAGKTVRYYQPLFIQPLCLNCHGGKEQMQPEVVGLLGKLYPEDQATGYRLGDFRGVVRVDFRLSE